MTEIPTKVVTEKVIIDIPDEDSRLGQMSFESRLKDILALHSSDSSSANKANEAIKELMADTTNIILPDSTPLPVIQSPTPIIPPTPTTLPLANQSTPLPVTQQVVKQPPPINTGIPKPTVTSTIPSPIIKK